MAERAKPTCEAGDCYRRTAALRAVSHPGIKEQEFQAASLTASASVCSLDFCCQHEVTLGKTVDLMGPDFDRGATPCQVNVRMVPFGLREVAYRVSETEGGNKVWK